MTRTPRPASLRCLLVAALLLSLSPLPCPAAPAVPWQPGEGCRVARLNPPQPGRTGFTLLRPEESGVLFTNQLSYDPSEKNQNLLNGAGLAAGDFDGDGWCDLYLCNLEGRNGLFRNLGNWRFEDVTDRAGVGCAHQRSRGAAFADLNGDGHLDLFVTSCGGPNACLINDGQGRFTDVTKAAGLVLEAGSHSLALADVEGDGDLDLYVCNYGENSLLRSGGAVSVRHVNGQPVVRGRHAKRLRIIDGLLIELGEPDFLYLNDGQARFTQASWTDGTFLAEDGQPLKSAPWDMGLSVAFHDLNTDGQPDLYVCNDFQTPDRVWINDGRGRFRALDEFALRSTPHFSMSVDFADVNLDGLPDLFITDMLSRYHHLRMRQIGATTPPASHVDQTIDRQQFRRNALFLSRGDGTYTEVANYAGVDASDWSWAQVFLDVDLDGHQDLLISNGHAYDTQDLDMHERRPPPNPLASAMRFGKNLADYPPLITPNLLFRNRGNLSFEEVGQAWGFHATNVSHGIVLADFDNDGDLDVAVNCLWTPPLLYRNESAAPRVAVRLRGLAPNTFGIGARVTLRGGPAPQSREISAGGRYLSGDQPACSFAAGSPNSPLTLEVAWRSGKRSRLVNVLPNHLYEIDERNASTPTPSNTPEPPPPSPKPLFTDLSHLIPHRHFETTFNDFERQPLLPKLLSRLGPGLAWLDLDANGHDDLVIGSGRDAALAAFLNNGQGGFSRWTHATWARFQPDDLTGLAAWSPGSNQRCLLVGLAAYEQTAKRTPPFLRYNLHPTQPQFLSPDLPPLPGTPPSSPGPLAVADVDGDGDLELFVGGRVRPGRYPQAASSLLYRNQNGQLQPDPRHSSLLQEVGLVSGAVWSDLNNDGFPELILACEWGPIRLFQNTGGQLQDATAQVGLDQFPGWWNGVATGDFDADGRLDIVASNWGLNSSYQDPSQHLVQVFYQDFDQNGTLDLLEATDDPLTGKIVPRRDLVLTSQGLPGLRLRFPTHLAYSQADLAAIAGRPLNTIPSLKVATLASTLFLTRTNRFQAVPLPTEAQFAPAFAVNVADFDGDGHEDLFLSQNFFAMRPEEPRLDSGRGLLLRGLGQGRLQPVPGQISGIKVYGEQRGAAVSDFDADGRPDLAVSQAGAATVLYRNQTGKAGLRVRLLGPPGNPDGIGAQLWLAFGQRHGPVREIHGGSGYWSQDSLVPVLATPENPTALWVRWPGGKTVSQPLPADAKEVTLSHTGELSRVR